MNELTEWLGDWRAHQKQARRLAERQEEPDQAEGEGNTADPSACLVPGVMEASQPRE